MTSIILCVIILSDQTHTSANTSSCEYLLPESVASLNQDQGYYSTELANQESVASTPCNEPTVPDNQGGHEAGLASPDMVVCGSAHFTHVRV